MAENPEDLIVTDAELRRQLPALAKELKIGGVDGSVPIFVTLVEAEAWEAKNPGKKALTLEPSTPDTTAPSWTATLAKKSVSSTSAVFTASALATDDRAVVGYQAQLDAASPWKPVSANGRDFEVTGLSMSTPYPGIRLRAVDAAGNYSSPLTAPSITTTAEAPKDFTHQWLGSQYASTWTDTKSGVALTGGSATVSGAEAVFAGMTGLAGSPATGALNLPAGAKTMTVVVRQTDTGADLYGVVGESNTAGVLLVPGGGGAKAGWYSSAQNANISGKVDTAKHVITIRLDGASSTLTHDRTTTSINASDPTFATFKVGGRIYSGAVTARDVAISEVRIYQRRLTDAEVTALHNEMGATYGIAV